MCTTPLAPRAAPGNCSSTAGRLPLAGDFSSMSPLKLRSVPEPRTGGRALTAIRPISLIGESATTIVAPADGTSTRNDAVPSGDVTSTLYVPIGTAGMLNRPASSVCALSETLPPAAVTLAPFAGTPLNVTLPNRVLVACADAMPNDERSKSKIRKSDGAHCAVRRM